MRQVGRFLLVGGTATLLQYLLLFIGMSLHLGPASLVSGTAFALSAVFNFQASRSFTFGSNAPAGRASFRFIAMTGSGLTLNTTIMEAMSQLGQHYLPSQILASAAVLIWNYFVSSRWVFCNLSPRFSTNRSGST